MEELLRYVCRELEVRNITYMLSGSVAMGAYTVARFTRDFDLVIELCRGMFNVIDGTSGFKIDFILKKETAFQQSAFERRQKGDIWNIDCWLISVEDLILAKLLWIQDLYSERQAEDIRNLLIDNMDLNSPYVRYWVANLSLNTYELF